MFMRSTRVMAGAAAIAVVSAAAVCGGGGSGDARPDGAADGVTAPTINISWEVPGDLPEGAGPADAAAFAWQEFIALNWPAVQQSGALNTRETPDQTKTFGDTTSGPLVWHTFRAKIEIFPAPGNTPNGYVSNAAQSYGYDVLPQYVYASAIHPLGGGQSGAVPWINLDENDEIGQDAMFAGVAGSLPSPGPLILFMAKGNRAEYNYVAANQFFQRSNAGPAQALSRQSVLANNASPRAGSADTASLPFGTIELKAAWRRLTSTEASSGRFYQTRVRYYVEDSTATPVDTAYVDATFGLVALHIIQKTPSRPYFVFATFEQADNILSAAGDPVETEDGGVKSQYTSLPPMAAVVSSRNAQMPSADTGYTPSNVQTLSPATSDSTPGSRLYVRNSPRFPTTQGTIAINRRIHSIPPEIVAANRAAHAAIAKYDTANHPGITSPWRFYKLVNVQYEPLTKPAGTPYTGADSARYYQANAVVETNYNLQLFSGMFQPSFYYPGRPTLVSRPGTITDWCGQNTKHPLDGCSATPGAFFNVRAGGHTFNMGGCMGCHGNAQVSGSDFSFIFLEVNNKTVQVADVLTAHTDTEKFFRIFRTVEPMTGAAQAAASTGPPQARPSTGTTQAAGPRR